MGLFISRLLRSNLLSGCEAAGLDELQHLTLSDLEECAASAEQTAAALPSLSIWERRHRVSEIFTRAPHQPGSTATERAKACLCVLCLVGLICLVGLLVSAPSGFSPSRSPIWFQPLPSFPEPLVTEAKALNTLSELLDDPRLLDWQKAKVAEIRQRCQSSLHGDRLVRCLVGISMSLCAQGFFAYYPRICRSVSLSYQEARPRGTE